MKKQIKEMLTLSNKHKTLVINGAFILTANYIDNSGFNVELSGKEPSEIKLTLEYTLKHDKCFGRRCEITSRTTTEVIAEIADNMQKMLDEIAKELVNNFKNGYLLGDVI